MEIVPVRLRPVQVEAVRVTASNVFEIEDWVRSHGSFATALRTVRALRIETREGDMLAIPGDWVVRGIENEFYAVRSSVFAETYEPA